MNAPDRRAALAASVDGTDVPDTQPDGLTPEQVRERLERFGPNELRHEAPPSWWRHLGRCYRNPFNALLSVLAVVSWLTDDPQGAAVIASMVVLATVLRFVQEGRSNRAAEQLKSLVAHTATVLRRDAAGKSTCLPCPVRELVPGDLVALCAGDMIPADCRLVQSRNLFVAQSALTGESMPVEKRPGIGGPGQAPLTPTDLVFMGTSVVSGSATARVVETGMRTSLGALAGRVAAHDRAPTAFQAGIDGVSWLLIRFALSMVPLVLLVNGWTQGDWPQAFLFALSVAVGLTPEMLPMIVTSTLARGAVLLARRKVIVKRLDAIQEFGAMDVLCTDKTGTLTDDLVAVERHVDPFGERSDDVLVCAHLNSLHQTGLRNPLDRAVLACVATRHDLAAWPPCRKLDEIPFDFVRRRMSVIVGTSESNSEAWLICKGALDEMLRVCSRVRSQTAGGSVDLALDTTTRSRVQAVGVDLESRGLRVLAVATKVLVPLDSGWSVADEADLTLVGFVAFLDPAKPSAAPALQALAAHGVAVKVLTGDNARVTARTCETVGLSFDHVLLGEQIETMDDGALTGAVASHRVFAQLTPLHKERVVRALRSAGHVVGFLGDGVNDAPALRAADIGISVDSAVDIAKEAADIILLEKDLMVLEAGVLEGRKTFCNMLKYIRMTASSNFGNVFSVLIASAFLPFLPMLPLQLLVQNLLYDLSQTTIPFDRVDPELIRRPVAWDPRGIGRFMVCFGPLSSVFDLCTFGLMWFVFQADTPAEQSMFQSGWFVVGLLTQTLVVHLIRTPRLPFIESRAAPIVLAATLAVMAVGIWLPMGPLAASLHLRALPSAYFVWLPAILLAYCVSVTVVKRRYIDRFGWQ